LFHGDARDVCARVPSERHFDLVYLDPPFTVGTTMSMRERAGEARGRRTKRAGRDAYHDGADLGALLAELEEVLASIRERMNDEASLWLHLDYRAVHDAKVAADRVFGRRAFAGEVIWIPGNGGRGARGFTVTHQTILIYARGDKRRLRYQVDHPLLREPFAATSQRMHFTHIDDSGRRYRERHINGKSYRYYADEGRRLGSVWSDVPAMIANTPLCREGTGYPTQKPERLLERIVTAASREGEVVADLMCGSGTTLVVAARLGRLFVGGDKSPVAIDVTKTRLDARGVAYRCASTSSRATRSASHMPRSEALPVPARS
jgi:site-specific DNA-methyltransferase (adenine-specific)